MPPDQLDQGIKPIELPAPRTAVAPRWQPGDKVRWREHVGFFLRESDDDQADVIIGARTYRVALRELRTP